MATDTPRQHSDTPSALPLGTRLGEFELRELLGVGGFGIVYLAFDHALEREVAVKEYMPASLAGRTETMHVSLRSRSDEETFALGLRSFVNEAKLLARFDHPSLLKVHRFWEANGTAYMAMPVLRGQTLKEASAAMSSRPDEAWLRALLMPLLGAIEKLHSEGVYHRDIAPDNIQIEPGGHPVLLDFGAARRVLSDKTQTLTAILKPAYAPIEQYAEAASVKQGPWTDLYALGATLHYVLLGHPPPPATTRAVHDEPTRLTTENVPGCSAAFLRAIEWMLAPRPADRPQSVAALRDVLEGRAEAPLQDAAAVPAARARAAQTGDGDATLVMPRDAEARTQVLPRATDIPTEPPARAENYDRTMAMPRAGGAGAPAAAAEPRVMPPPPRAAGRGLWLGIAAAAVVAGVAAVALWPRTPPTAATSPVALPAALPEPASAAVQAAASAAQPPAVQAPAAAPPVAESAVATVVVGDRPAPPPAVAASRTAAAPRAPATVAAAPSSPRLPQQPRTTPAAATPAAPAEAPRAAAAEPAPATAPPTGPAAAAPEPEPPRTVAATPEGRCSGRNPLRYIVCMERECLRSEFVSHPDCLKWRKDAKRE